MGSRCLYSSVLRSASGFPSEGLLRYVPLCLFLRDHAMDLGVAVLAFCILQPCLFCGSFLLNHPVTPHMVQQGELNHRFCAADRAVIDDAAVLGTGGLPRAVLMLIVIDMIPRRGKNRLGLLVSAAGADIQRQAIILAGRPLGIVAEGIVMAKGLSDSGRAQVPGGGGIAEEFAAEAALPVLLHSAVFTAGGAQYSCTAPFSQPAEAAA